MRLKYSWEVQGTGDAEINLTEVEDLTPEGVQSWCLEGAEMDVLEQGGFTIKLSIDCEPDDLIDAIAAEKKDRDS